MWPLYVTAFTTFSYSMGGLALQMLRSARVFVAFIGLATAAALITRRVRRIWLASEPVFASPKMILTRSSTVSI